VSLRTLWSRRLTLTSKPGGCSVVNGISHWPIRHSQKVLHLVWQSLLAQSRHTGYTTRPAQAASAPGTNATWHYHSMHLHRTQPGDHHHITLRDFDIEPIATSVLASCAVGASPRSGPSIHDFITSRLRVTWVLH